MTDLTPCITDALPLLGAYSTDELIFWTEAELWGWMDDAAQRLARSALVCVERTATSTDDGVAQLPARHLATLQADVLGFVLRPASVLELEALDAGWPTAVGWGPWRYTQDGKTITLHPGRTEDGGVFAVNLVAAMSPDTVAPGNPSVPVSSVLRDYFTLSAVAEARAKETKAAMPEVADWLKQVAALYVEVCRNYWGVTR